MPIQPPTACRRCECAKPCGCGTQIPQGQESKPFSIRDYHADHSKLYWRSRWRHPVRGLQAAIMRRDPLCKICGREASAVADHIVPHRGDEKLFWDAKNLQGLCDQCHKKKTAAEIHGRQGYQSQSTILEPTPRTVPSGPDQDFDYLAAIGGRPAGT